MRLSPRFYSAIRNFTNSEQFLIASGQLLGLISFYVIVVGAKPETVKLMSLYVSAQAASAFILLAIQFSSKRESVLSFQFIGFLIIYFLFIFLCFRGFSGSNIINEFITVAVFLIVCCIQLIVTALKQYKLLLSLQILFAVLLPFVVLYPLVVMLFLTALFAFISVHLKLYSIFQSPSFSFVDVKSWGYSIGMQSPFILYPLFDPILSDRVNIEVYGNYLIYGKLIFGVSNFCFSFFQFKLIKGENLDLNKIPYFIIFIIFVSFLLIQFKIPLYINVLFLALIINTGSLFVRSSLDHCRVPHLLVSAWSVIMYLGGLLYFPDRFFKNENAYFILFLIICISISVLAVWISVRFNRALRLK